MSFTEYVVEFILIVYLFSAIMFLIRIVRGPTIFDRIVAVDALSYDLTVFMALIAFYVNRPLVATPMMLIALWAYALDVCISRALRHRDMG